MGGVHTFLAGCGPALAGGSVKRDVDPSGRRVPRSVPSVSLIVSLNSLLLEEMEEQTQEQHSAVRLVIS